MLDLSKVGISDAAVPHVYLADLRGLEFIDPSTFGLMFDYVHTNAARLKRNVEKLVQIRPDGITGAIVSGFSTIARAPFPDQVCATVDEAIAHLGVAPEEGRALLAELSEVRQGALTKHEPVARLRALLERVENCSLEHASKQLGLSTRAMQRALKESGTSYREEIRSMRLHRSMQLLRDPSKQVTWIAVELGFSSLQHFVTMFRRATGETPTEWRVREGQLEANMSEAVARTNV